VKNLSYEILNSRATLLCKIFELDTSTVNATCHFLRNFRSQLLAEISQAPVVSKLQLVDLFIAELRKKNADFNSPIDSSDEPRQSNFGYPLELFSSAKKSLSKLLPAQLKSKALLPITQFLSEDAWGIDGTVLKWMPIFISLASSMTSFEQVKRSDLN
jgi:hypothetical protein